MILELEMASDTPIYQQIRDQVVLGLATQVLLPNESLPSVRQLAEDLGVNMMTVSKAYILLKEQGYVETDRRQGTKVVNQVTPAASFENDFKQRLQLLLAEGTVNQLSTEQLQILCQNLVADFERKD